MLQRYRLAYRLSVRITYRYLRRVHIRRVSVLIFQRIPAVSQRQCFADFYVFAFRVFTPVHRHDRQIAVLQRRIRYEHSFPVRTAYFQTVQRKRLHEPTRLDVYALVYARYVRIPFFRRQIPFPVRDVPSKEFVPFLCGLYPARPIALAYTHSVTVFLRDYMVFSVICVDRYVVFFIQQTDFDRHCVRWSVDRGPARLVFVQRHRIRLRCSVHAPYDIRPLSFYAPHYRYVVLIIVQKLRIRRFKIACDLCCRIVISVFQSRYQRMIYRTASAVT